MEQSRFSEDESSSASPELQRILWNPEGSLPCSQEPAACPSPEPDQSSPRPHLISWRSSLLLSYHTLLGLPSGFFPSGLSSKRLYATFLFPTLPPSCADCLGILRASTFRSPEGLSRPAMR
jgi:hypothetical protein